MRNHRHHLMAALLGVVFSAELSLPASPVTYQGRLEDGGVPANGDYDVSFLVWSLPSGGMLPLTDQTFDPVPVTNGLFTVALELDGKILKDGPLWLELYVRPSGSTNDYTQLSPRQPITTAPYAVMAENVTGPVQADQLAGTLPAAVIADDTITSAMLAAGSVTPSELDSGIAIWAQDGTNIHRMDGNVGIGTVTPTEKLEVDGGNIRIRGVDGYDAPGESAYLYLGSSTGTYVKATRSFGMNLGTVGAQDVITIRSQSGNVGIGTTNPATALHVVGTATATAFAGDGSQLTGVLPPPGMVLIPAGEFTMGNLIGDSGVPNATPVAANTSAFYMDEKEVTWSQWRSVYLWANNHGYNFVNSADTPGFEVRRPNHPVVAVDWYQCVKWCNARSEQAGLTPVYYTDATQTTVYRTGEMDLTNACVKWDANGYRLPTEAEWEKAARGGLSGQRFPWGNEIGHDLANYNSDTNYTYDYASPGFHPLGNNDSPYTTPVGMFAANTYGLYDMSGNTAEWCWDWWDQQYAGGTDPRGPDEPLFYASWRVWRGGSSQQSAIIARCDFRGAHEPWHWSVRGFRCVRGL